MKHFTKMLVMLLLGINTFVFAQDQVVTGRVTDNADGSSIPGVNVAVKGSNTGTITDFNGEFKITVPSSNAILVFSFVGYAKREVKVGDQSTINLALNAEVTALSEVVVTALGIEKDRKSLGYSVSEIDGKGLTQAREINVANSLIGKVAGVNIGGLAGGPGASTSVIIRGASSISQSNQPLYVVNGVPISNARAGDVGRWGEFPDRGDGIGNINPDDIESISVLKGAAASAIYGARGKAGVILITTKSAKKSDRGTVEFNSNYVAERVMDLTNFQTVYGNGRFNRKPETVAEALDAGQQSWGAKLDGSDVIQFDGERRPYVAQKDNLKNFYETGSTFTNTISFSKGFNKGAYRLSLSDLNNSSIIPNSGLKRKTVNLTTNFDITDRISVDARANYINEFAKNRPILSDFPGNSNFNVMFLPTSIDIRTLNPGTTDNGNERRYSNSNFATNPYFAAHEFVNNTSRERLISSVSAKYKLENGFFVQGRVGRDSHTDRFTNVVPTGTNYRASGSIGEESRTFSELNMDVLIGKPFAVNNDLIITPNAGANLMKQRLEIISTNGQRFIIPHFHTITNTANRQVDYSDIRQEMQSVYGTMEIAYKDFLFFNASGRNDWFSTLAPGDQLGIFYPSVSSSFVFSEFLPEGLMNLGKVRVGYANVGQATDPYITTLTYGFNNFTLTKITDGVPAQITSGRITPGPIPNNNLKPSLASEFEIGTEMSFYDSRLTVDFSFYNKVSKNEIIAGPTSIASGFSAAMLNIGEMRNRGFELLISGTPVRAGKFTWNTTLNGSINDNKIISLAEGVSEIQVPGGVSRRGNGFIHHVEGLPAFQVMAFDYERDGSGNIVLENGIPKRGELKAYGSALHRINAGFVNEINYGNFNAGFIIDGKFGGKIFSSSEQYATRFGLHEKTVAGRENLESGVDPQNYYEAYSDRVSGQFVYDASFIKFRQFTLGYNLPTKWFNNKIQNANISLVGRNLFILMRKTDNIDPEAAFSIGTPGLEMGGVPPVRTYGFNLNIKL